MEILRRMKVKFKLSKGEAGSYYMTIAAIVVLIITLQGVISFSLKQLRLSNITFAVARYASLASTKSEQSILYFANNLLQNNDLGSAVTTITAPSGVTAPGSEIQITTTLTNPVSNDLDLTWPEIETSFIVIKEGE